MPGTITIMTGSPTKALARKREGSTLEEFRKRIKVRMKASVMGYFRSWGLRGWYGVELCYR